MYILFKIWLIWYIESKFPSQAVLDLDRSNTNELVTSSINTYRADMSYDVNSIYSYLDPFKRYSV